MPWGVNRYTLEENILYYVLLLSQVSPERPLTLPVTYESVPVKPVPAPEFSYESAQVSAPAPESAHFLNLSQEPVPAPKFS